MRTSAYLAILGISVVVAAGSLGTMLSRYLGLRAYVPKAAARAAESAGQAVPATPPEQWTNLFAPAQGMNLPSRLSAGGKGEAQATRTNFVLVGTIVSPNPSTRRAILWADGMKQPKAFSEKEEVEPGAMLSSIERDKVWITRGKEREKLDLLPVGSRSRPTTAAASPAGAPTVDAASPAPSSPPAAPSLPGSAPPPGRALSVASPEVDSAGAEEELSSRERRRRARGLRR